MTTLATPDNEQEWIEIPDGWGQAKESSSSSSERDKQRNEQPDSDDERPAMDIFANPDPRESYCFRIPKNNNNNNDNDDMLVELTGFHLDSDETSHSTGVTLWGASPRLAKYITLEQHYCIHGKKVVELGAGLGLCGIVAHKLGAAQVVITDGDTNALREMRMNVEKNCSSKGCEQDIVCRQLLWDESPTMSFLDTFGSFDTILAADVIYVPESIDPLFDTAVRLMRPIKGSQFILSWMTRWNNVPVDLVVQAAKERNLSWTPAPGQEGIYVMKRVGDD